MTILAPATDASRASGSAKPHLRGWLHASAAPAAVIVSVLLARAARTDESRLSVVVFGIGLVGLFTISATYHVPRWPERVRTILGRADVAMIQVFIAATFTPVAVHALEGSWRTWSLIIAWAIAVGGGAIAASPLQGPRWLGVTGFATFGALALAAVGRALPSLPLPGTMMLVGGALTYLIGGVVYARKRPNPVPHWFEFHEVFHAAVICAAAVHAFAIYRYVLPLA